MPKFHQVLLGMCLGVGLLTSCSLTKVETAPRAQYSKLLESTPYQRVLDVPISPIEILPGYRLIPKADFKIASRVLSINTFWMGDLAKIAPLDLAMGWNKMSDLGYLRYTNISISQGNRTYSWYVPSMDKANRFDIENNSANIHIIPANREVASALKQLSQHDLVYMEGFLVDIVAQDGGIKTSLRRSDTGAGSCEVLYVKKVVKLV